MAGIGSLATGGVSGVGNLENQIEATNTKIKNGGQLSMAESLGLQIDMQKLSTEQGAVTALVKGLKDANTSAMRNIA